MLHGESENEVRGGMRIWIWSHLKSTTQLGGIWQRKYVDPSALHCLTHLTLDSQSSPFFVFMPFWWASIKKSFGQIVIGILITAIIFPLLFALSRLSYFHRFIFRHRRRGLWVERTHIYPPHHFNMHVVGVCIDIALSSLALSFISLQMWHDSTKIFSNSSFKSFIALLLGAKWNL